MTESKRLTADNTSDLERFTDLLEMLLNAVWGEGWGVFSEEFPTGNTPEENPIPHITYNLVSRKKTPGRSLKKTAFESVPDPEHEGEVITSYREWFDCTLEFTIFGRTNRESRQVSEAFEELIDTYRGYLKQEGISEILFEEEMSAGLGGSSRQGLPQRNLRYTVRTERTSITRSYALKEIELKLQAIDLNLNVDSQGYRARFGDQPEGLSHISSPAATHMGSPDFLNLYEQNFPKQKEETQ